MKKVILYIRSQNRKQNGNLCWIKHLFIYFGKKEPNTHLQENTMTIKPRVFTCAKLADWNYFLLMPNLIQEQVGRVFSNQLIRRMSWRNQIIHWECAG